MVGINVYGTLIATGNSGAHVIFTSAAGTPAPGDWKGIYVADGGNANLDYTEIRYGGGFFWWHPNWGNHYGNLRKDATGTLTITNSLITQSAGCGLRFDHPAGVNSITNTTISNNQNYGACLNGNYSQHHHLHEFHLYRQPTAGDYHLRRTAPGSVLVLLMYWTRRFMSPVGILMWTVPGVRRSICWMKSRCIPGIHSPFQRERSVKFNGMTWLVVNGTLDAHGVDGSHVLFTSLLDDTGGHERGWQCSFRHARGLEGHLCAGCWECQPGLHRNSLWWRLFLDVIEIGETIMAICARMPPAH